MAEPMVPLRPVAKALGYYVLETDTGFSLKSDSSENVRELWLHQLVDDKIYVGLSNFRYGGFSTIIYDDQILIIEL